MDDTEKLIYKELQTLRKEVRAGFDKINDRIRKLENWRSYLTGAVAVLGALSGTLLVAFLR